AGVFTGLLSFFITNCLLPPSVVDKVRTLIWLSGQGSEPPAADDATPGLATLAGPPVPLKADSASSADPRPLVDRRQSVHIQYGSKDELVITVAPGSKNDLTASPPKTQPTTSTCKYDSSRDSPWVPVYDDGAR